jgi:hypothetical protein
MINTHQRCYLDESTRLVNQERGFAALLRAIWRRGDRDPRAAGLAALRAPPSPRHPTARTLEKSVRLGRVSILIGVPTVYD